MGWIYVKAAVRIRDIPCLWHICALACSLYKTTRGKDDWSLSVIQGILKNEKYKGDVLLQKTFIVDIFNKKSQKNTGELPMYLYKNHHIPIINPAVFDKVQVEIARRNSMKSTSDKNATENSRFSSKYALTGLVECGECGGKYRRTTWSKRGKKKVVWRCISRLEHGTKYCKDSPTIEELWFKSYWDGWKYEFHKELRNGIWRCMWWRAESGRRNVSAINHLYLLAVHLKFEPSIK